MSEPKNQHFVPASYLRQFVDPNTPEGYEPYVWIFERESKIGDKKSPDNILAKTDFYTLKTKLGGKDYAIEKSLSQLESEYAIVFNKKIKNKIPLSNYERIILCSFVAAMLHRTLKHKEHMEAFFDQLIEMTEKMEKSHGLPAKKSLELKKKKENVHKISILKMIPHTTETLLKMNLAFLCTNKLGSFITSDAPCFLFNPRLQWQRFYGPNLTQRDVEVRMPLSPEISVSFSWINNLRGYLGIDTDLIHECNRMVFGYSHQYFIANSPKVKRRWFRRFPLDPIFMTRILKNRTWPQIKNWVKSHFRKYV